MAYAILREMACDYLKQLNKPVCSPFSLVSESVVALLKNSHHP